MMIGSDRTHVQRIACVLIMAACAALGAACAEPTNTDPSRARGARIHSSNGFSFMPPQGDRWTEEWSDNQILYVRDTEDRTTSFYVGALEGLTRVTWADSSELLAFVREKKAQWGDPDRYVNTTSAFDIEVQHPSCVRYALKADDLGARNAGNASHLVLQGIGRYCRHPDRPDAVVDLYYSIRHAPDTDVGRFIAEGEAFLDSLLFARPGDAPQSRPSGSP